MAGTPLLTNTSNVEDGFEFPGLARPIYGMKGNTSVKWEFISRAQVYRASLARRTYQSFCYIKPCYQIVLTDAE